MEDQVAELVMVFPVEFNNITFIRFHFYSAHECADLSIPITLLCHI